MYVPFTLLKIRSTGITLYVTLNYTILALNTVSELNLCTYNRKYDLPHTRQVNTVKK